MRTAKSVLAATDLSPRGDAAVEAAFCLAAATDAEVHLLHVFPAHRAQPDCATTLVLDASERAAEHRLRNAAQTRVSSVRRGKVVILRGDVAALIVDTAQKLGADLLIVGAHDCQDIERLRLGSVVERVVRYAPCSVLVVRERVPCR